MTRPADDSPFEYDPEAHALYYRLASAPVHRTAAISDRVSVDVDAAGEVIGIEVLNPPGFTPEAERLGNGGS